MTNEIKPKEIKKCNKCDFIGRIHNGKTFNFYKDGTREKDGTPRFRNDCTSCFKKTRTGWEKRNRGLIKKYKEAHCCKKCGIKGHWKLDFHHTNGNKEFNIGDRAGKISWSSMEKEIEKCTLLCKNCHADLHYEEGIENASK